MPRRTKLSQERARSLVCDGLAGGQSLSEVCAAPGMPNRKTVLRWVESDEKFREAYRLARLHLADFHFDQIIKISDAVAGSQNVAEVTAARLQVDARKWVLAKLHPERFADRFEMTGAGGADLIPPQEVDTGKLALALVALIEAAKREAEPQQITIDAEAVEPEALPAPDPPGGRGGHLYL